MTLDLAKDSYLLHQKDEKQKRKIDKLDLIKIKNFCASKDIHESAKTAHRMGENICKSLI